MKIILLLASLFALNVHADEGKILTAPFIGEYKLVEVVKETKNHFTVRGSKCREQLKISLSKDQSLLILLSQNLTRVGETMNWIELLRTEGNTTISNEELLKQTRSGNSELFGINTRIDLVTTLAKKENKLELKYEEIHNSVLSKDNIVNVSDCLYEAIGE